MQRHYDYRPKWTTIALCSLFFGACALVLGAKATSNDRGLIINRLIELSADGATIFYWILTALSVGFVVVAGFMAIVRLKFHQQIELAESSIIFPRSRWSNEVVTVRFCEIVEMFASEVYGQRLLKIVYGGGEFTLAGSMLPRKEDFEEICAVLSRGVKSSRLHQ